MRKSMEEVRFLLKSRCECIWINTYEEAQVLKDLREIMAKEYRNMKLFVWSNTEGMKVLPISKGEKAEPADKKTREIPALFEAIRHAVEEGANSDVHNLSGAVYVLRDLHNLMQDPRARRCIRDIKEYRSNRYLPIIVIAPTNEIHEEVAKLFRVVDYGLPDKEMIHDYVAGANVRLKKAVNDGKPGYKPVDEDQFGPFVNACVGLTTNEIDNLLYRSMVKHKTLNLDYILQDKIEAVRKSGLLDYKQPKITLDDLGGNVVLKEWLMEVKEQFGQEAREFGLEQPKGALFLGVPGAGNVTKIYTYA